MSREIGGRFRSKDDALTFLNSREFFFGDPIVVKYIDEEDSNKVKLLFAIGKANNPTITTGTTEVTGAVGPDAYELFEIGDTEAEIERLWRALNAETSNRENSDGELQGQINDVKDLIEALNELISEISGETFNFKEITGDGWTDSPDNVTITDRIKRDEKLSGIQWGHYDDEPYDGKLPNTHLKYASGESLAEMIESVNEALTGVLFEDGNVTKTIKFDYNSERNILYYTAGTETGNIELSQAAVVEDAYYDKETEELVIIFKLGEGKTQEVKIPIGDLIEEWDVADTDSVHLSKERSAGAGADILSATVKVSDDSDNMLVSKGDGLYVPNSGLTKLDRAVSTIKEDLAVLEDGHFPTDYFSGSTVNGSTNLQEAILKLDAGLAGAGDAITTLSEDVEAKYDELNDKIDAGDAALANAIDLINAELPKLKSEVKLADDVSHLTLESGFSADGHVFYELGESDIASESAVNDAINGIQSQIDGLNDELADETAARENIELVELPLQQLDPDVKAAYVLSNNGVTGSTIIKIFKDSVIYKIYLGHVDDRITSPTDPTVIPGTGATAICFIYFNANGEYELAAERFDALDQIWEAINVETDSRIAADEEIVNSIEELEGEIEDALANIDAKISVALTGVTNAANSAIILAKENNNTVSGDVKISTDSKNMLEKLDDGKLFVNNSGVTRANELCDTLSGITGNFRHLLNTNQDGHFTARFIGSHTSTAETYYDAVNALDAAVDEAAVSSRVVNFTYDSDGQNLILTYLVNGNENSISVDVSDFVKDSFLNGVQVVYHEGVQCLEFSFVTYDGEPVPIYVELSQLAVIYTAGDGIDSHLLDSSRIIKLKLDETRKNWLSLSSNGLAVTGISEAINEALSGVESLVTGITRDLNTEISERRSADNEIWDALREEISNRENGDTGLNNAITAETNAREEEDSRLSDRIDSEASTRQNADGEILTALQEETSARETGDAELSDSITAETKSREEEDERIWDAINAEISARTDSDNELRDEIDDIRDEVSGLTEDYVRKDEVEGHLDSASTLPVQNKVVTEALGEIRDDLDDVMESLSAFTADTIVVNDITADTIVTNEISGTNANFTNITAQTIQTNTIVGEEANFSGLTANTVYAGEYQNLPTATTSQYGVVILDDHLDSGSTNPVENSVIAVAINDLNDGIDGINDDINDLKDEISAITESGLYEVRVDGTGNVITGLTKDDTAVVATLGTLSFDVDDHIDSASTNPVENRVLYRIINDDEEVIAAAFNDLNDRKANKEDLENLADDLNNEIDNIERRVESGLTGVQMSGTGNVVTGITKQGNNVVAELGEINVDVDDHLDSGSTNPVENSVITNVITNIEEAIETLSGGGLTGVTTTGSGNAVVNITKDGQSVKATFGTLEDVANKVTSIDSGSTDTQYPSAKAVYNAISEIDIDNYYTKQEVDAAISAITFDVDDHLDSASTNPVENRAITSVITNMEEAIETLSGGGLTGVTTTGSGNVITGITKQGNSVVAELGNVDVSGKVDTNVFNNFTASTLNDVTTSGTGSIVTNVEKDGDDVKVTKTNQLTLSGITAETVNATGITATTESVGNLTASTINTTDISATTVSATTYNNLPTATTANYGMVIIDDHLDSGSTHAVMNSAITQTIIHNELVAAAAFNDLNDRKADLDDVPTSITELDGVNTLATKSELGDYLPLSGGTLTGGLSGTTVSADTFNSQTGFFQTSDERYKIFMGDVENAIEKANSVPTKYFYWKDRCDGPRYLGTSAQKVQEVFPELVKEEGDKLSVDYAGLSIVALAAIKELTAKVDELQRQIDELKK